MWKWLKWQRQKWRIRTCNHPRPWIVLEVSETIWWRAWISLEFYEGKERPKDDIPLSPWCHARHLKCRKCGGTLNEIELGKRWLADKNHVCVKSAPHYIDKLAKECGTLHI